MHKKQLARPCRWQGAALGAICACAALGFEGTVSAPDACAEARESEACDAALPWPVMRPVAVIPPFPWAIAVGAAETESGGGNPKL